MMYLIHLLGLAWAALGVVWSVNLERVDYEPSPFPEKSLPLMWGLYPPKLFHSVTADDTNNTKPYCYGFYISWGVGLWCLRYLFTRSRRG